MSKPERDFHDQDGIFPVPGGRCRRSMITGIERFGRSTGGNTMQRILDFTVATLAGTLALSCAVPVARAQTSAPFHQCLVIPALSSLLPAVQIPARNRLIVRHASFNSYTSGLHIPTAAVFV